MMDLILPVFKLNLWYSQKLVADLTDEQMCAQPIDGRVMNHPAFLLGHLALVAGNFATSFVVRRRSAPKNGRNYSTRAPSRWPTARAIRRRRNWSRRWKTPIPV